MSQEISPYRSFICYRRRNEKHSAYVASENIAGALAWWLNHEDRFCSSSPALYEEHHSPTDGICFDEAGIQKFMPKMKRFFMVICPGFFDNIISIYNQLFSTIDDHNITIAATRGALDNSKNQLKHIVYKEIYYAQEHDCQIIPVLINGGDQTPDRINILEGLFGEKFKEALTVTNLLTLNYTPEMAKIFENFCWSTAPDAQIKTVMEELDSLGDISVFKDNLEKHYHKEAQVLAQDRRTVHRNLRACAQTIINNRRPPFLRDDPENETTGFCASNPLVVYDPVRAPYDPKNGPPYLASCMVESFNKLKETCDLPHDRFVYWDVDCDPQKKGSGISVCALCFATMIIHHHLTKDMRDAEEHANIAWFNGTVQTGINTLVAIRDPYEKTWPSSWIFDKQHMGIEGTVNQTTISLSALLTCGFLDSVDLSPEALKNRVEFVWESADCLLNTEIHEISENGMHLASWGYTYGTDEPGVLLPTLFVFDTFLKLKQKLQPLCRYFIDRDPEFSELLDKRCKILNGELQEILCYIQSEQLQIGLHSGAFCRKGDSEISRTHTAYVIKSLHGYLQQTENPTPFVREILADAENYLLGCIRDARLHNDMRFYEFERFENFCAPRFKDEKNSPYHSNFGEKYVHCAELLVAEALIKIAGNPENSPCVREEATSLTDWLLHIYNKQIITNENHLLLVKGTNPDFDYLDYDYPPLNYPIFHLYYYRMVMWDYLQLKEKQEETV